MDRDQFLVCQAGGNDLHRVCLIDNRGNLIKSFGSIEESGNANLSDPYRLVVDRNGFILVADYSNNRVVLLNKPIGIRKRYHSSLDEVVWFFHGIFGRGQRKIIFV